MIYRELVIETSLDNAPVSSHRTRGTGRCLCTCEHQEYVPVAIQGSNASMPVLLLEDDDVFVQLRESHGRAG